MSDVKRPLILAEECFGGADDRDVHVAEVIDADGRTGFWVLGEPGGDQSPVRVPEHERLGPLPWTMLRRLDELPTAGRCNAVTKAGTACRKPAAGCHFHTKGGAR